jgi:hypothetical protein
VSAQFPELWGQTSNGEQVFIPHILAFLLSDYHQITIGFNMPGSYAHITEEILQAIGESAK